MVMFDIVEFWKFLKFVHRIGVEEKVESEVKIRAYSRLRPKPNIATLFAAHLKIKTLPFAVHRKMKTLPIAAHQNMKRAPIAAHTTWIKLG